MKRITRVISLITGAISSFFVVGCDRPSGKIYGPPEMLEECQRTGKLHPSGTEGADGDVAKPENAAKSEMPENEEPPTAIYGPPEMFGLAPEAVPEANGAPEVFETAPVYGVPDAPPQPELKNAPETAPEKAKADDAADRNVSDKDLKLLKEAERTNLIYTLYGCE